MAKKQSSRLFENDLLESLTHVHPIVPLVVWTPVCAYFLFQSVWIQKLSGLELVTWAFIALLVWTFTEYILHRFVFHFDIELIDVCKAFE